VAVLGCDDAAVQRLVGGHVFVPAEDFPGAAARRLTIPTLLVRGRMSDLLSEQGAQELLAMVPHAQLVDVAGAGHMVAGDRNDVFDRAVVTFLESVRAG